MTAMTAATHTSTADGNPTAHPASGTRTTGTRTALWRPGLVTALAAAGATSAVAATASAAGVTFAGPDGSSVPLLGFAQLTAIFGTVGLVLAAALRRWARRPSRTFVTATVALTAVSLVPDAIFGFDPVSATVLMATHLLAAAIVIPVIARRLPIHR